MLFYVVLDYDKGMYLNSPHMFGKTKRRKKFMYMKFHALVAATEFTSNSNRSLCTTKL